ncbi:hypothetical protein F5Y11DRAFT_353539 [Daldinia sp. FL1419]|nr:hypothetical protein F5Y11DRAFT_353539 [Daldinia sp. FL1419]
MARRYSAADPLSLLKISVRKCDKLHGGKCRVKPPKGVLDFWIIDTQGNCLVPGGGVDKYVGLPAVFLDSALIWQPLIKAKSSHDAHCHFAPTKNCRRKIKGGGFELDMRSECYKSMLEEADGRDQGSFFLKGKNCSRRGRNRFPKAWRDKTYDFYNVLWVEKKGDFMERKAAGRIPKDVWERNRGGLERIELG